MSSRSLQQARARRAGENAPPVSGNRPITSIGSQAAFAQQMPNGMGYNMPPPPNNVRIAKAQPKQPPQQTYQNQQYQNQQYQNQQQPQQTQQNPNGLPFTKLSISDAIGLITLRLGRVEQWIIDTDAENENGVGVNKSNISSIPDGCKIVENSVLTTIVNRLDALEKNGGSSEEITNAITLLTDQFKRMADDVSKHTIEISKNTEQVYRFNRELTETKDILKSFMVKYDMFAQETAQNFADYEVALGDLEKRIPEVIPNDEIVDEKVINESQGTNLDNIDTDENINMAIELKNSVKELLNI